MPEHACTQVLNRATKPILSKMNTTNNTSEKSSFGTVSLNPKTEEYETTSMFEVIDKKTVSQICKYNAKLEAKKIKGKQTEKKLRTQVEALKEKLRAAEEKLNEVEYTNKYKQSLPIQMEAQGHSGKPLAGEREFFENVVEHVTLFNSEKIESFEAYKCLDGHYYQVNVRCPCDANGNPDEAKVFFAIEKVEGMN